MFLFPPPVIYDDDEPLYIGDSVRVKSDVPLTGGRRGVIIHIDEKIGDYTVQFRGGTTMTYDRDMIYKIFGE